MQIYLAPIIIGVILLAVIIFYSYKASKFSYVCTQCKKEYNFNPLAVALAPQSKNHKYLKCPNCRTKRLFALKYKG